MSHPWLKAKCHFLGQRRPSTEPDRLTPPLLDSPWLLGPPERPIRIVLSGVSGPIEVDALRFQLEMPSFGTLSDHDIADVLTYARRIWEHTASPVHPKMVTEIRQETRDHVGTWTAEELSKVGSAVQTKTP